MTPKQEQEMKAREFESWNAMELLNLFASRAIAYHLAPLETTGSLHKEREAVRNELLRRLDAQMQEQEVEELKRELDFSRRMIRTAENAFELQDAVSIPGRTGELNCLQIAKAWLALEKRAEAAESKLAALESQGVGGANEHSLGDPLWPVYEEYVATKPTKLMTYSGWLRQVAERLKASPSPIPGPRPTALTPAQPQVETGLEGSGKTSLEPQWLRMRILEMMQLRGWSTSWIHRSAYLHLEAAELAEAVRGKHGNPLKESADVLITLLALSPFDLDAIIPEAEKIVAELRTKPRYPSEAGTWTDAALSSHPASPNADETELGG